MQRIIRQKIKTCSRLPITYNIDKTSFIECSSNNQYWTKEEEIAEGSTSTVYIACCETKTDKTTSNCNFILKLIDHNKIKINNDDIQKEILLQQKFYLHNLCPPVVEAFFCESELLSFIITKPKQSSLQDLCIKLKSSCTCDVPLKSKSKNACKQILKLIQKAIDLIFLASSFGLYHNDVHFENFRSDIHVSSVHENINEAINTLQFIDCGRSNSFPINSSDSIDLKKKNILMFFDHLMSKPYAYIIYDYIDKGEFKEALDLIYRKTVDNQLNGLSCLN